MPSFPPFEVYYAQSYTEAYKKHESIQPEFDTLLNDFSLGEINTKNEKEYNRLKRDTKHVDVYELKEEDKNGPARIYGLQYIDESKGKYIWLAVLCGNKNNQGNSERGDISEAFGICFEKNKEGKIKVENRKAKINPVFVAILKELASDKPEETKMANVQQLIDRADDAIKNKLVKIEKKKLKPASVQNAPSADEQRKKIRELLVKEVFSKKPDDPTHEVLLDKLVEIAIKEKVENTPDILNKGLEELQKRLKRDRVISTYDLKMLALALNQKDNKQGQDTAKNILQMFTPKDEPENPIFSDNEMYQPSFLPNLLNKMAEIARDSENQGHGSGAGNKVTYVSGSKNLLWCSFRELKEKAKKELGGGGKNIGIAGFQNQKKQAS